MWNDANDHIALMGTGNVGIGTTNPSEKLEVAGNVKITGSRIKNSAGYGIVQTDATDWLRINPDSQYPAIALYNPVAIGTGGLAIGEWSQQPSGVLKVTQSAYLATAGGNVGIGTTNPVKKLDVVGDVNATGYVYGMTGLCIGADCKTSWSQVGGTGPWDNSTSQIFVRAGYPLFVNISNALLVNGTSSSIQLKPTSVIPLPLNGTIYYDASLNKFRCYQNGIWTDCITSVTEPGAGFWTLTGSMLYPNQTSWNVGIGTTTPSEKLEVQGSVLVASSNPFELEPSDQILDVKGSINATGNLYVGGNNIYGSGGVLRIALGDTTSISTNLLSLSGNLLVGGNNIQNSTGINRISFYPGYILFNDNVRIGGNVIQNSTGTNRISFLAGITEFNDDIKVSGNNIRDSGNSIRITLGDTTSISASLLSLSGNLRIGGNIIQNSTGTNRITLSAGVIEFNDNVKIGGNNIQNSTGINRISFYPGYILFNDNVRIGGNIIQDSSGTNRITLGGTTTLNSNLVLSAGSWVNATNFNSSNLICLGGICKNTWPSSSLAGGSGASGQVAFWVGSDTISGDNSLTWDNTNKRLGIGTNVPSEKLEVQGSVLVASSNPFELEPSDQILDVKGSINATVVIFIPKQSSQPFACDASKAGAIFYNTTNNKFYGCNSTNWVIIGG
jgi:hypothetical protein